MALSSYESALCPCGCGFPAEVSQAPDNEFAFEGDGPYRCHARTALLREAERMGDEVQFPEALLWAAAKKS